MKVQNKNIESLIAFLESRTILTVSLLDKQFAIIEHESKGKEKVLMSGFSLVMKCNDIEEIVTIEYLSFLTPSRIKRLGDLKEKSNDEIVLVSDYISPSAQSELKTNKISFVEMNGSIFILGRQIYIDIKGEGSKRSKVKKKSTGYSKKAMQLIEWIVDNSIKDKTYKEISNGSKVSEGLIAETFKQLVQDKYLFKNERKYLKNTKKDLTKLYLKNKISKK